MPITLRPLQAPFIEDIRAAFADGAHRVMAVAPTAFGKTKVFSYIADSARMLGNRVFIQLPRRELVRQTSQSLLEDEIPHGVICAGYAEQNFPIQLCSIQTFIRRMHRIRPLGSNDLMIFDEAHLSPDTIAEVMEWCGDAAILGVTATPVRTDGRGFDKLFDTLVVGPSVHELMNAQPKPWLARPLLRAPDIPEIDLSDVPVLAGEYHQGKLAAAMQKPIIIGSAIDHYLKYLPHMPSTVVFCASVQIAHDMAAAFRERGVPAEAIDGSMSDWERIQIINRMKSGETRVMTSCSLVDVGFDLPKIENMIDLSPTKSIARSIQRIGRVLRIFPGKDTVTIFDHVRNWELHLFSECPSPLIDDPSRQWTLEGRKKRTTKAKGEALVQCPGPCFAVFPPAPVCPVCGRVMKKEATGRKLEEVEGELVEIDLKSAAARFPKAPPPVTKVRKLERA